MHRTRRQNGARSLRSGWDGSSVRLSLPLSGGSKKRATQAKRATRARVDPSARALRDARYERPDIAYCARRGISRPPIAWRTKPYTSSEFRCGYAVEPRRGFQTNRRRPKARSGGKEPPAGISLGVGIALKENAKC